MVAKSLKGAVMAQLNGTKGEKIETLRDVARHGADTGVGGFTYYADTVPFARRNRSLIVEALREDVDSFGVANVPAMLTSWPAFKHYKPHEVEGVWVDYLQGRKADDATLLNVLAWYALERVAHGMDE